MTDREQDTKMVSGPNGVSDFPMTDRITTEALDEIARLKAVVVETSARASAIADDRGNRTGIEIRDAIDAARYAEMAYKAALVGAAPALIRAARENSGCPCLHTSPCDERCTCVNPWSSSGCRRCCAYGTPEQQRAQAEGIIRAARELQRLRDAYAERARLALAVATWAEQEGRQGYLVTNGQCPQWGEYTVARDAYEVTEAEVLNPTAEPTDG